MKTVFILGAGASKPAGLPVMSDFLERARHIQRNMQGQPGIESFTRVFQAIDGKARSIHSKILLENRENIETWFGLIDMGLMIGKFGKQTREEIEHLREDFITMISKTIELSGKFSPNAPPSPYGEFAQVLQDNTFSSLEFSFITFNYDVLLEFSLAGAGIKYDYCLNDSDNQQKSFQFIKLHGSVNWGICQGCDEIIPVDPKITSISTGKDPYRILQAGAILSTKNHCGKPLNPIPFLVPPTWNKANINQNKVLTLWEKAANALSQAEKIIVIGYSMPETDIFFKYLIALGLDSDNHIHRFYLIDPDPGVGQRFQKLMGPALPTQTGDHGRFRHNQSNFDTHFITTSSLRSILLDGL